MQSTSLTLQDRSRFVRLITDFSANKPNPADYNLAERLGHFVGVSGSMNLARGLRGLSATQNKVGGGDPAAIQSNVLNTRADMIRNIVDSFLPEVTDTQTKLPTAATGVRPEALKTFEPYQRFYTTHQVEMAVGIKAMRDQLRTAISIISPELHKLSELDKTLDDSLESHARKQFNIAPKVLEQRFKTLFQQQPETKADQSDLALESEAWLRQFHSDMRELLLAEFEVRLQPVFGLLEALNEHEGITS